MASSPPLLPSLEDLPLGLAARLVSLGHVEGCRQRTRSSSQAVPPSQDRLESQQRVKEVEVMRINTRHFTSSRGAARLS
ncbi:hypothetical protein NHX12_025388 [Muraenolepis orangiensis]|uniref:Uncharacterized protein n=1 Tax=Muraenolepis orangiensis TaxID=630683 RepID=A0A9Q0EJX6_9TELE|nr:hypothetical protein NHX12_025388 [Muraenolepis orangiensis]